MNRPENRRTLLFVALCCVCLCSIVGYGLFTARKPTLPSKARPSEATQQLVPTLSPTKPPAPDARASAAPAKPVSDSPSRVDPPKTVVRQEKAHTVTVPTRATAESPFLYFRTNALGPNYGKLTVAPLTGLDQTQYSKELSCDRVHYNGDAGVCLVADRGLFTKYYAIIFDRQLRPVHTLPLGGEPSRVRVSPTGRLAAVTVFLSGHSYASLTFSTQTTIIDLKNGKALCDLETFSVSRDNVPFQSADFNFWGVTFTHNENKFYATLWSNGQTHLVEADLLKRTARVLREGIECPSVSPDNTRIAFKKRSAPGGHVTWRLTLLDLKTMAETALGEVRNVDDQVEWLDNEHILYALSDSETGSSASTNIWKLPASAGGAPQLLLKGAYSPAVVYQHQIPPAEPDSPQN